MSDKPNQPYADAPLGDAETAAISPRPSHAPLDKIGPYRILERIGQGGMGEVYKAEQREPVRRIVALKVIKLGMDTCEVVARFEAERQALAMLSHPNVAKVFDGGMTESGRPYFAMEHVPGVPLTDYCNQNKLSTKQRLELFVPICNAIQHAHQKGIIHRDLKPSNILVQMFDGHPVPKVIDFGIAKATSSALTQQTLFTQTGAMVGTPEYMSPEQAMTSGLDVDTRTDIYSLGVILYELLTGTLPFDAKTLRQAGLEGMARIIKESEPQKPSTRLMTLGHAKADAATLHRPDARTLQREISGDLDWITLKAMEKDRTRRYETANGLALDIGRHLNDEMVLARPPSAAYRMNKFVRKHKAGVVTAALILIALLLGVIATSVALVAAKRSELAARSAEALAKAAEGKAKDLADKSASLSRFLEDLLSSASPATAGGRATKVVDILDRASAEMSDKLRDQPEVEISARMTVGKTYYALSLIPSARQNFQRAYDLAQTIYGKEAEKTLDIAADLIYAITLSNDAKSAAPFAEQIFEASRRTLGEHHRITYSATNSLSGVLTNCGQTERGVAIIRQLVRDARAHPAIVPQDQYARYLNNCAASITGVLKIRDDPQMSVEQEECLREVVQLSARGVKIDPLILTIARSNLSAVLVGHGKYPEALQTVRGALIYARATLGDANLSTRELIARLAGILDEMQQFDEAASLHREQLDYALVRQPVDQQEIAELKRQLAFDLNITGKFDEAAVLNADYIATRQKLNGIYDEPSRRLWSQISVLNLSVDEPWASPAVRASACEMVYALLYFHPSWPMPADQIAPERLRFKLFAWKGESAGKEMALSPVAQGSLGDLRNLADPAPGVYLFWLEMPRGDRSPLHQADWITFAPWQVASFDIAAAPEEDAAAWEKAIRQKPTSQVAIGSLAISPFWHPYADTPHGKIAFGTVGEMSLDFPAGPYTVATSSSAAHRISIDDRPAGPWVGAAENEIRNGAGPTKFRVEHYHLHGANRAFSFQLRPNGAVVDAAVTSLIDPMEAIGQALNKLGNDPQIVRLPELLELRAKAYFSAGRFKESADDFGALVKLQPEEHSHYYRRGCLLAYLGDAQAYRSHCQEILRRFESTKDHSIAERTAKTCLLIAGAGGDLTRINGLIDKAMGPGRPEEFLSWFQLAKGMVEYRLGHFDAAIDWLGKSTLSLKGTGLANAHAYLAMAHFRAGDKAKAMAALSAASEIVNKQLPQARVKPLDDFDIENWLIAHVSLREAEALMKAERP